MMGLRENSLNGQRFEWYTWLYVFVFVFFAKYIYLEMKIYWDTKALVNALAGCPSTHKVNEWKTVLKGMWKRSFRMGFWKFTNCKSFESHINTYWRAITKEEALIKSNRETEPAIWHLPSSVIITMHTLMELPWWQEGRLVYKSKHHWLAHIKLDPDIATTKCPNYQPQRPTLSWWYGTMPQRQQQVTW